MSRYSPAIENLSPDALQELQWKKLLYHLKHAYDTNPFYRTRWDRAGVTLDKIADPKAFRELVPLITKADLLADQKENPPYGTRMGFRDQDLVGLYWTSGTSGIGQELYGHTTVDTWYYGLTWSHGLYWQGVRRGNVLFNTWPGSVGQLAGPDSLTRGLILLGANGIHIGTQSTDEKLKYMRRFPPKHLAVVPAYLQRLAAACAENGFTPREAFPNLESIVLATESFGVDWAEQMEEIWGCRLHEMYGSTQQGGGLAFTCELGAVHDHQPGHMHVLEHLSYVEVLDKETREPVGPGEEGELVLTTLNRDSSTLVRFATDDKVVFLPRGDCRCGRPFFSFRSGAVARYDDMIKMKMVNVWPAAIDAIVLMRPEVAEYQGRVYMTESGNETVEVRVEFIPELAHDHRRTLERDLAAVLRERVGVRMDVVEAAAPLPRFEFKVRRWTDERKAGRERVLYTVS
ncbi:MAG: phenylacetate-coenzyme ligase [Candidatus Eremiobacteraeota bacterium]|nr:phenylacetate-coenzyme ligase [Candidatus Eremiobacteraeota bacterium]